jgi:hypothetical protein
LMTFADSALRRKLTNALAARASLAPFMKTAVNTIG